MIERVRRVLRDRALEAQSLLESLNREVVPTLKELRQRFNELVDVVNGIVDTDTVDPGAITPGDDGDYLRTTAGVAGWAPLGTVPLPNLNQAVGSDGDVITKVAGVWAAATPATGASPVTRFDLTHSPVALYHFNGDRTDSSGNSFDLSVLIGTERYGHWFPGLKGFFFDGCTLYHNATPAGLRISGDVTIEIIVCVTSIGGTIYGTLVEHGVRAAGAGNNRMYGIATVSPLIMEASSGVFGAEATFSPTDSGLPFGELFLLGATRTSNVWQQYVNGLPRGAASGALAAPVDGSTGMLHVGGNSANPGGRCVLGGLKIINSALTAAQMKAEYNRTLGTHYGTIA